MKTVQLAIGNAEYAQSLRDLLLRDGTHRVYLVDFPDLRLDGVVVIESNRPENLALLDSEPERFVVITRKGSDCLSRIWNAGVRHVLFEGDAPNTAQLAIIAAELRLPVAREARAAVEGAQHPGVHRLELSVIDPPVRSGHARFSTGRMDPYQEN